MRKILVPIDFSTPSKEALKLAASIGNLVKGEITVVHVIYVPQIYDPSYAGGDPFYLDPSLSGQIEQDVRLTFEAVKSEIRKTYPDVGILLKIEYGEVITTIERIADEKNCDLIVMGTSGTSGLAEILVGSNTEKVVRHSNVPVLAVRKALDLSRVKDILLPSTLPLDEQVMINNVKSLQDLLGATLHVLRINTPAHFVTDSEAAASMSKFATHYKLRDYKLHFKNYLSEEDGILDFASKNNIQLIAMLTHARKGIAHLLNGSVTESVVNHGEVLVWSFSTKIKKEQPVLNF